MLLYRYIIKEHIFPFFASLGLIVFLFIMQQAILMLDRVVSKEIDPIVVLEVFLIQLGWILALGVPMAILSATLMTFGRMAGDNEITAIKASGRSMTALMIPVIAAAAVVTVSLFFFHDLILPEANHRAANLLGDISRKRPAAFIEPGVLIKDFPNYVLYVEEVNAKTGDLGGVRIFSDDPAQDPTVTIAERGNIRMTGDGEYIEISLYDGETHSADRKSEGRDYFAVKFERQTFHLKNIDTQLERTVEGSRGDREKNISSMAEDLRGFRESNAAMMAEYGAVIDSLSAYIAKMSEFSIDTLINNTSDTASDPTETFDNWAATLGGGARFAMNRARTDQGVAERTIRGTKSNDAMIAQYMVEVHKKFAIPAACLVFVLIGAPLGIMARRGGMAVGASYSVFFFVLYWIFLIYGENLADNLVVSPAVGMWSGNAVLALCGVVLMMLMLRETTINFSFVKSFFSRRAPLIGRVARMWIFRLPGLIFLAMFKLPKMLLNLFGGRLPTYLIGIFLGYVIGLMAALVVTFVTIDYVSNLSRFSDASYRQLALYYYYYLPWIVQTVLPIVLFLSSMFSMGRLSKTSELTAMKAAGVNIRQLTTPLLFFGFLLTVGVFYGGEEVIPYANEQRRLIRGNFSREAKPAAQPQVVREYRRNFFYLGAPNTMYVFGEFCTEPQFFRQVTRYTFSGNGITERAEAAAADYDSAGWRFSKGQTRRFDNGAMRVEKFESLPDTILNKPPSELVKRLRSVEEMSYWELSGFIEAAKHRGESVQKYAAELQFKIAFPIMNFIVILLGLSLAARTGRRKGGAALLGVGLLMSFTYWILCRLALVFAQNGFIPIFWGAWIGNILFFTIGAVLYRKAAY